MLVAADNGTASACQRAGEKLIIVPKNVALTFASEKPAVAAFIDTDESRAHSPAQKWLDFLRGKGVPD